MKKIYQNLLYEAIIVYSLFVCARYANAGLLNTQTSGEINKLVGDLADKSGFDKSASLTDVVATVVQAFFGLLGIIFVILMLVAGYTWMTAGGDEEKIRKAKTSINRAIIGLIITVGAYAITYFVFSRLPGGDVGP